LFFKAATAAGIVRFDMGMAWWEVGCSFQMDPEVALAVAFQVPAERAVMAEFEADKMRRQ
jgi:hypothetical protein